MLAITSVAIRDKEVSTAALNPGIPTLSAEINMDDDDYEIVHAPPDPWLPAAEPVPEKPHILLLQLQADVAALTAKIDLLTEQMAALHAADTLANASVHTGVKPVNAFKLPAPPAVGTTLLQQQSYTVRVGMLLDVLDTKGKWYLSEVLAVSKANILVHYLGWAQRWDEWLPIDNHARIQPAYSHTAGAYSPKPTAAVKPTYLHPPPWPRSMNDSG